MTKYKLKVRHSKMSSKSRQLSSRKRVYVRNGIRFREDLPPLTMEYYVFSEKESRIKQERIRRMIKCAESNMPQVLSENKGKKA